MSNRQKLPPGTAVQPVNSLRKQDGTFAKGVSGNPGGRPHGARSRLTQALDLLVEPDATAVLAATVERAKGGDVAAARLIMRRAWPVPKGRPVEGVVLPPIKTMADAVSAMSAIAEAISAGAISSDEARDLTEVLDTFRKIQELTDIESRITSLEKAARREQSTQGS